MWYNPYNNKAIVPKSMIMDSNAKNVRARPFKRKWKNASKCDQGILY